MTSSTDPEPHFAHSDENRPVRAGSVTPTSNGAAAQALLARGIEAHRRGQLDQARACYDRVVDAAADISVLVTDARFHLGILDLQTQQVASAIAQFRTVLQEAPDHGAARLNLGVALRLQGDVDAALSAFAAVVLLGDPALSAAAYCATGAVRMERDEPDLAEVAFRSAIAAQPTHVGAHNDLGLVLKAQDQLDSAIERFRDALRIDPTYVPALVNLGQAVTMAGDPDAGTAPLSRAAALAPNFAPARLEFANALMALHDYEAALPHYRHGLLYAPDAALGWQNLGAACFETGDTAGALAALERALEIHPDLAIARFNRASLLLAEGRYDDGWQEYEARLSVWGSPLPPSCTMPRWHGETLAGKHILIHAEQGLGDTIQFLRFVHDVAAQAEKITLAVPTSLMPICTIMPAQVIPTHHLTDGIAADFHCPIASLPFALKIASVDRFDAGSYLQTPTPGVPVRSESPAAASATGGWRGWIGRRTKASAIGPRRRDATAGVNQAHVRRIGLTWSGRPPRTTDGTQYDKRALPLDELESVMSLPGFEWHVIQTDIKSADRAFLDTWRASNPGRCVDHSHALRHFGDTAAIVAELECVVCVDTAVAHLAGAMGKPVFLMLPFAADWRWSRAARTADNLSKWYPTVHILQQTRRGDWSGCVDTVAERLVRRPASATR